ncbi:MAG: NUDIX hydrolase [Chloroflexi bacterium]|nr:NUDIX hydrolase [Chloroflexota bacterium]
MKNNSPYKTISSRIAWSCPWYSVRQDEIITPDGRPGVYNTIAKSDAVWIVPVTPNGQIVMIHNYRYTVDDWCWEVPAGGVKPGQTLEEAAREELLEEVGGTAVALQKFGQFYSANGICNEMGHYYLATGVTLGATNHESTEVMEVRLIPIDEALRMARAGEISDGTAVLALLLCESKLREIKD